VADYRLYCFAQSGNSYKAALTLQLLSASWEPRFVDFFNGETRSSAYREGVNAMGEAPVLEHAGKRLAQSGVILHYAAERFGKYGGRNEDERREVLRWILWDNHKFTSFIATLRFMLAFQKTGETPVTEFLRGRIKGNAAILEKHLAAQPFAAGGEPTIADFSLCGYLYYPEETGVSLPELPAINAWLGRIKALPGWVHPYELMPGHPLPAKK
jgi:glutathione S-transferase